MRAFSPLWVVLFFLAIVCRSAANEPRQPAQSAVSAAPARAGQGKFVEGRDYVMFERKRFLDQQGFDRPVEAFSALIPRGWNAEGGVRWGGILGCRGDIVAASLTVSSPDNAFRLESKPSRTFVWSSEQMMLGALQAGAQQGGCQIGQPFDASQYIQHYAATELNGAASNIRPDDSQALLMRQMDEQANAIARQYGQDSQQRTTTSFGDISWPDGRRGVLHIGVTSMVTRRPDMLGGPPVIFSSTSVYYSVLVSFPEGGRDEAMKIYRMIQTGYRQNPVWKQAKESFLTRLGNMEHAGRMERIRLMGEQARAYAKSRDEAVDRQMRDWETRQASQDQQHKAFVQTMREVETWKDSSGTVELTSGYNQAWSRGDGTYILSNLSTFDPSSVFQDQRWQQMVRAKP